MALDRLKITAHQRDAFKKYFKKMDIEKTFEERFNEANDKIKDAEENFG